ncbi:MAG TPA: WG repeat-containing protein [Cytophagaceae bacterium]
MRLITLLYIFFIALSGKAQQTDSTGNSKPVCSVYFQKGMIKKGKVQLPDSVFSQLHFSEGLAALKIIDTTILYAGGSIGFIDRAGKMVVPFVYDTIVQPFQNGLAIAGVSKDYFNPSDIWYGVSTQKGKLFKFQYKEIGTIEKGLIPVRDEYGKWGFFSVSGKPLYTPFCQDYRIISGSRILVKESEKWGLLDVAGGILIPVTNKAIHFEDDKCEVEKFSKWEYIQIADQTKIAEFDGDSVVLEGNLFKVVNNGKWRLLKADGSPLTELLFDEIKVYPPSHIVVKKEGRYALMNTSGDLLTGFNYNDMEPDSLGYIKVKKPSFRRYGHTIIENVDELWEGLLDSNGARVIPAVYKSLGRVSCESHWNTAVEGDSNGTNLKVQISNVSKLLPFQSKDGKWGYLNLKNEIVIHPAYNFADRFVKGLAEVTTDKGTRLINSKGEVVVAEEDFELYKSGVGITLELVENNDSIKAPYYNVNKKALNRYASYSKAGTLYIVTDDGKMGLTDSAGKIVLPAIYESIKKEDTLFLVKLNGQYGYVNSNGSFTMPLTDRYTIVSPLHNGYAVIQKGNSYGFIDYMGNLRISVQYKQVKPFSEGLAPVMINGKWGYIDKHENIVIQPNYKDATSFKNGLARVKTDKRWDFINSKGEKVSSSSYDEITELSDGKYLLMRSYRYGLADISGRELIGAKYEQVEDLGNGYIKVKKDGKYGITDYKENIIYPFEYDQLLKGKKEGTIWLKKNQGRQVITIVNSAK